MPVATKTARTIPAIRATEGDELPPVPAENPTTVGDGVGDRIDSTETLTLCTEAEDKPEAPRLLAV